VFEYDTSSIIDDLNFYALQCDFVIHLAGVNRAENPKEYIKGNIEFTRTLLQTLEKAGNSVPVLFSSSTHVEYDTDYGKSKKVAEGLIINYSKKFNLKSYIYRLPNLFGKGSRPNRNGVVGTFCYNIANDLPVTISDRATQLTLVYIDDLVSELVNAIASKENRINETFCAIPKVYQASLGEIVDLINKFRSGDVIPASMLDFEKAMYETYLSYLSEK